jgi:hypothetical protein
MAKKRALMTRNTIQYVGWLFSLLVFLAPAQGQYYYPGDYYQYPYGADQDEGPPQPPAQQNPQQPPGQEPTRGLQYDNRDAESIQRDQWQQYQQQNQPAEAPAQQRPAQRGMYDDPSTHRIHDEGQVRTVMAEARRLGNMIGNRNGKPFILIDKRNFQFYLYDLNGTLLRVGPVAVGKGKTRIGAFESPVGIFPIKSKVAVDDWIRPDWYFIEEGEQIPKRWEDRRVPGFFRYKLVYDGLRYIHYAEATGGRLTHGCLGLDWQDAEAVFHTLQVGSFCVILDDGFLSRLAKGEFPVQKPAPKPTVARPGEPRDAPQTLAAGEDFTTSRPNGTPARSEGGEKPLRSLW